MERFINTRGIHYSVLKKEFLKQLRYYSKLQEEDCAYMYDMFCITAKNMLEGGEPIYMDGIGRIGFRQLKAFKSNLSNAIIPPRAKLKYYADQKLSGKIKLKSMQKVI